jgi:hypothetical protein
VVADGTACRSTENTMMTGKMPCGTAHQGAFDAPFGLGRCRYGDERDRNRSASKSLVHLLLPGIKRTEMETTRLSKKFQVSARPGWRD